MLKLDGNKVSGTSESSHLGKSTLSNGLWANNKLRFTIETDHGAMTLTGVLQKSKLVGEWSAGQRQGKWEAKRR